MHFEHSLQCAFFSDAERDHSRDEGPVALVVEGLAWYTTDASLEKVFGRYGKVCQQPKCGKYAVG